LVRWRCSWHLSGCTASWLYGLEANDPLTIAASAAALLAVALAAVYLPARRAALLDPLTALRQE